MNMLGTASFWVLALSVRHRPWQIILRILVPGRGGRSLWVSLFYTVSPRSVWISMSDIVWETKQNKWKKSWRVGSALQSPCCSCRGIDPVPSTYVYHLTTTHNPKFKRSQFLSALGRHMHACTHIQARTYTQQKIKALKFLKGDSTKTGANRWCHARQRCLMCHIILLITCFWKRSWWYFLWRVKDMVIPTSTCLLYSLTPLVSHLAGVACTQSLSSHGLSHAHQSLSLPGFLFNKLHSPFNYFNW